jgi:hypothetical protein
MLGRQKDVTIFTTEAGHRNNFEIRDRLYDGAKTGKCMNVGMLPASPDDAAASLSSVCVRVWLSRA